MGGPFGLQRRQDPNPNPVAHRRPLNLLFLAVSLLFLGVNLACALLARTSSSDAHAIVLVRVAVNDTLFVLSAVSLSVCLYKIAKMSLANIYLESKVRGRVLGRGSPRVPPEARSCNSACVLQGTSVCQVTGVGAVVVLLYSSRACYNLVVLALSNNSVDSFDYDWYNVSDQVSRRNSGKCVQNLGWWGLGWGAEGSWL